MSLSLPICALSRSLYLSFSSSFSLFLSIYLAPYIYIYIMIRYYIIYESVCIYLARSFTPPPPYLPVPRPSRRPTRALLRCARARLRERGLGAWAGIVARGIEFPRPPSCRPRCVL